MIHRLDNFNTSVTLKHDVYAHVLPRHYAIFIVTLAGHSVNNHDVAEQANRT